MNDFDLPLPGPDFFRALLDSLTEHLVVIDERGLIRWVNRAWMEFGVDNGADPGASWLGVNYLDVCLSPTPRYDEDARQAYEGILGVIRGQQRLFSLEYPCHGPHERRWFMMQVKAMEGAGASGYVISHQNITARKLAEEEAQRLCLVDGLTGIANRRHFDDFLHREWRMARRNRTALSLVILDIDYFKRFNDHYGHQSGDTSLRQVAELIQRHARRPGDLAARYGGEEFALILSDTRLEQAVEIADRIRLAVQGLAIPHACSPLGDVLTLSAGVAVAYPDGSDSEEVLIALADKGLYGAKERGRNQVAVYHGQMTP